jgi:hypothetical protein
MIDMATVVLAAPEVTSLEALAAAAVGTGLKFIWDKVQESRKWKKLREEAAAILRNPTLTNNVTVALAQAALEKLLPQLAVEAQKVKDAFNVGPIVPTVNYAGKPGVDFDMEEDPTPKSGKPPMPPNAARARAKPRGKRPTFKVQFDESSTSELRLDE